MSEKMEKYLEHRLHRFCELNNIPIINNRIAPEHMEGIRDFINAERKCITIARKKFAIEKDAELNINDILKTIGQPNEKGEKT